MQSTLMQDDMVPNSFFIVDVYISNKLSIVCLFSMFKQKPTW